MQTIDEHIEFVENNKQCSYFDNEISDIRYKFMQSCSESEYQGMLEHGWRRFGKMHFVPECAACTKCISMRIDVKKYVFSKSEKRVINKNKDTKVYIQTPSLSIEHLALYDKYHEFMHHKKNWNYTPIEPMEYQRSYVQGKSTYAKEILYCVEDKLVGVALSDILTTSISSIYCFYDHDYAHLSLGKYSILAQIKIAKEMNVENIYLGYWIEDHFSMGYKKAYTPFEILKNRVPLNQKTIWEPYEV